MSGSLMVTASGLCFGAREEPLRRSPPKLFFLGRPFKILPLPELFCRLCCWCCCRTHCCCVSSGDRLGLVALDATDGGAGGGLCGME